MNGPAVGQLNSLPIYLRMPNIQANGGEALNSQLVFLANSKLPPMCRAWTYTLPTADRATCLLSIERNGAAVLYLLANGCHALLCNGLRDGYTQ